MKCSWSTNINSNFSIAKNISISEIINYYDMGTGHKIKCKFPHHKGGNERTASLYIYEESNSFYCFGCNVGGSPIDFVSNMESLSVDDSVDYIISNLNTELSNIKESKNKSYDIKTFVLLSSLSNRIKKLNHIYIDHAYYGQLQEITRSLDEILNKNHLSDDAIKFVASRYLEELNNKFKSF